MKKKCSCKTREIEITPEELVAHMVWNKCPEGSKERVLYDLELSMRSIEKCFGEPCFWIGAIKNAIDYINREKK